MSSAKNVTERDAKVAAHRLTSLILWHELDAELVKALAPHGALLDAFAPGSAEYLAAFDSEALERAAEEYCALFVLPEGVSPRAATWVEGDVNTAGASISLAARNAMQALNLDQVNDDFGVLPEDHVAHLLSIAAAAIAQNQPDLARSLVEPWREAFAEALLARETSPLYRACANILLAFDSE